MSKQLAAHVYINDKDGQPRLFSPGDRVPKWAREKITNPKAWAEVADPEPTEPEDDDEGDTGSGDGSDGDAGSSEPQGDAPTGEKPRVAIPPKNGPGSGADEWRKYAEDNEFEVDDDAKRDEIIAALEANDIPTE